MYNKYIKNLAPRFTWASAFLSPHVSGDIRPWRLKVAFRLWLPWFYNPRYWALWGLKCQILLTFGICIPQCWCSNLSFVSLSNLSLPLTLSAKPVHLFATYQLSIAQTLNQNSFLHTSHVTSLTCSPNFILPEDLKTSFTKSHLQ